MSNPDPMTKLTAILGAVATALIAFNTWQVNQFETKFREVQSERELNFRIYESIAESIESGDLQRILAVRALVDALASEDVKNGFMSALDAGEVRVYHTESAAPAPLQVAQRTNRQGLGDWDFDIFWCSASGGEAEAQANAIVKQLIDEGGQGRIRPRVLPEKIKATDPYESLATYEIRYDPGNERETAELVKRIAESALPAGTSIDLRVNDEGQPTAWYISLFVCP